MEPMHRLSRRALLASGAGALAACSRRKGSGYDGLVFVANQQGRDVAAVDLMTFSVARRISLNAAPAAVLAHPAGRAVYVLCPEAGLIHEFDSAARLRRTARLPAPALAMRLSPTAPALWALCRGPDALVQVPLDTFRPAARLRLPAPAADFDLNSTGAAAVAFPRENRVGLAPPGAATLETLLPAPGEPSIVRFRSDGRQFVAGHRAARTVSFYDVARRRAVVHLPLPLEPVNFCFNPDGGQLFVSGPGRDAVSIVYPYSTEVAETILAGRGPDSLAVSNVPPYLFVANPASATVTVLDVDTRKLVAVAGVGADPGQILFTPDNQYVLILNRGSGDLAVMRILSLRTSADGKTRRYTSPPLFNLIPVGSRPIAAAVLPA